MAEMTFRTTFTLDAPAIQRLKTLSRRWGVSQAEVIRRALETAERQPVATEPADALVRYHNQGGLAAERAESYLSQWSADRDEGWS